MYISEKLHTTITHYVFMYLFSYINSTKWVNTNCTVVIMQIQTHIVQNLAHNYLETNVMGIVLYNIPI